jgi:hypothetical protein
MVSPMVNNDPQPQSLHPFQVVLTAFVFFNVPREGAIKKAGLVNVMVAARCPNERTAHGILDRMVEQGLLKKHTDPKTGDSYSRTELGIQRTPSLTPPPRPSIQG